MWTVNLKGLHNVLEAARDYKLRRVVHLGSCHTENPHGLFNDADVRRPDGTMYAVIKRLQEECCRQHHEAHGTRIVVLRPDYIVDAALGIGRFGERLPGRLCGTDGWVDRRDLADAVVKALHRGGDFEILHAVHTTAPGRKPPVEVCNVSRTRRELGWSPRADLDKFRPLAPRIVDCHSHAWPAVSDAADDEKYPLHPTATPQMLAPASFDVAELKGFMHAAGVSRCVLVGHNIFHGADNSYLFDAVAAEPDTFRVTARERCSATRPSLTTTTTRGPASLAHCIPKPRACVRVSDC